MTKGRLLRLCAVLGSVLLLALALPRTVSAHTFLVQSAPQAGQRLGVSPRTVSLQFSEAVAAHGARVTVTGADGHVAPLGPFATTEGGTELSAAFPTLTSGVSATTSWPQTLASWLALWGRLSISAGGLLSEMLIWRPLARVPPDTAPPTPLEVAAPVRDERVAAPAAARGDDRPDRPRRMAAHASRSGMGATPAASSGPAVPGQIAMPRPLLYSALLAALVGAIWSFVLMAAALQGSGPLAGLYPSAWGAVAHTPAGALALAGAGLTLYALVALCVLRVPVMSEQITSGPHATAHSVYHQSGAKLMDSEPYTGRVSEVRRLPSGEGLTQLVLYLPGSSIWARLWVDAQGRLRREELVPPSYLIQHTFSYPTH